MENMSKLEDVPECIEQMLVKYASPKTQAHSRHVAGLSLQLFDTLVTVHRLDSSWRETVYAAALLHDIGHFISKRKHHEHGYYLIVNDPLLDEWDGNRRTAAALAALNHRKPGLRRLDKGLKANRKALKSVISLVRIADMLDYEHEQRVSTVQAAPDPERRTIELKFEGIDIFENADPFVQKLRWVVKVWNMPIRLHNGEQKITIDK